MLRVSKFGTVISTKVQNQGRYDYSQCIGAWDDLLASAYKKQGRATIARLVAKSRGHRRGKSRTPPTK